MSSGSSSQNTSFSQKGDTTEQLATQNQQQQTQQNSQTTNGLTSGTGQGTQEGYQQGISTTGPWAQAQPTLTGLLSGVNTQLGNVGPNANETSAINQLISNAGTAPNWAPQAIDLTNKYISGDPSGLLQPALSNYNTALSPIANASLDPMQTPGLRQYLETQANDITNQIRGQFAGAGRDFSGLEQQAIGRGVTQGLAPTVFNQYNANVANRLGAANAMFGGAGATADRMAGNQGQAFNYASYVPEAQNYQANATLQAEAMRRGIPISQLQSLSGISVPIAGLGNQTETGQGTYQQTNTQEQQQTQQQQDSTAFAEALSQMLGESAGLSNVSGQSNTNTTSSPSLLQSLLMGSQIFGNLAGGIKNISDRRAKDDIEQIGALYDGTPVYRFRYKGDAATQVGLMADDVEKYAPHAVSEQAGLKFVDYRAATDRAAGRA